jgi:ParB family transcriptional regulator, chromosome partitioning protein
MTVHEIKTRADVFDASAKGLKTFEFRYDDRGYEVGDQLRLLEFTDGREFGALTGRVLTVVVTYLLRGGEFGIPTGYVVMSIKEKRG